MKNMDIPLRASRLILISFLFALSLSFSLPAQKKPTLTVKEIMQDPDRWIGSLPSLPSASFNDQAFFFRWGKDSAGLDRIFLFTPANPEPRRASAEEKKNRIPTDGIWDKERKRELFGRDGDLFIYHLSGHRLQRLTATVEQEQPLAFGKNGYSVYYLLRNNVFALDLPSGSIRQLTDIRKGRTPEGKSPTLSPKERWLQEQQLYLFDVLKEKEQKREASKKEEKREDRPSPRPIYTGDGTATGFTVSPGGRFVTWLVIHRPAESKGTEIPHFVTRSGYTTIQHSRPKVGTPYITSTDLYIYDRKNDTALKVDPLQIPGIHDIPAYWRDYPGRDTAGHTRRVLFTPPLWSPDGEHLFTDIYAADHKDRWIMLLDPATGRLHLLDRQHDEAWIGGPGIGWWEGRRGWLPDSRHIWFQSERTGYSHLYTLDISTGKIHAITSGKYEVYDPFLSRDGKHWYFTSNEVDPGEKHFYRMDLDGRNKIRLTTMEGWNEVVLSADEQYLVIRHSFANRPWELYLQKNVPGARPRQVTHSLRPDFQRYPWRVPRFITFPASDGARVPARLYLPDTLASGGKAVIFVHGAGYLQNAHKGWSDYFREYMFHNLLADKGYIVLDIDYRGSAGYGRDWRTAIYRHMGGKDLDDQVDGAKYLIDTFRVDPRRIGIYGGSYGGFITLMAMFTRPGTFTCGAALRAVTDWAHYNHGYTSEILNTPVEDSLAYVRSSPIYFADGLRGNLLMCHGMVDDNVHFQDIVRLTQRLIELGKENWELAVYPVERHAFKEPSSWTDEYRRILRLFETTLDHPDPR